MTKLVNAADGIVHVGVGRRDGATGKRFFLRLACQDQNDSKAANLWTQPLRLSLHSDSVSAEEIAVDELFYAVDDDGPVGNGMIYSAMSTLQKSHATAYIVAYMTGLRLNDLRVLLGASEASVTKV